jgi:hypothetical protein
MRHQGNGSKQSIRVKDWGEFKRLALEEKPKSIVYIISQSIPARNLTSLQLVMHTRDTQYFFTDFAKGDKLRQTRARPYTQRRKRQQVPRRQRREELPENTVGEGRPADFLLLDNVTFEVVC